MQNSFVDQSQLTLNSKKQHPADLEVVRSPACHSEGVIDLHHVTHRHTDVLCIPEKNCDKEITLIRKKSGVLEGILGLEFNLVIRKLTVTHSTSSKRFEPALRDD